MDFPRWLLQHLVGNLRVTRRAQALLETEEQGFDVVHVHGALAAILLNRALSNRPVPIPLVYTEHDSTPWSCRYRRRLERSVRRYVYRQVNLRACRAATTVVTQLRVLGGRTGRSGRYSALSVHDGPECAPMRAGWPSTAPTPRA